MEIRFFRDRDSGLPHCLDHNVEEQEVAEVFANSPLRLHGRGGAYMALGQTDAGRHLKVIYRRDKGDDAVFVVTAYDLRGKELAAYRRRRRRRGKP